ncbi:MAG: S24 family peptidase [Chloroflexota bacterium]
MARLNQQPIMVPETRQPALAGSGVGEAEAETWPYYPSPDERSHRFIAVPVEGDCMTPRLWPGHRAIVDLDASPRSGDLVLAVHDGEALLKVLEERDGERWLVALHGRPPLKINGGTRVLGVVRQAVYRP